MEKAPSTSCEVACPKETRLCFGKYHVSEIIRDLLRAAVSVVPEGRKEA